MNRRKNFIISIFIATVSAFPVFTDSAFTEEQSAQDTELERLDKIKKKHDSDYNSGRYNDSKKDYVKGWLDEDIGYQKKVIKLKSDYKAWAMDKISREESVNYTEYISLKSYSAAEKDILLDYHKKHFSDMMIKKTSAESATKSGTDNKISSNKATLNTGNKEAYKKSRISRAKNNKFRNIKKIHVKKDADIAQVLQEEPAYKTDVNESVRQFNPFWVYVFIIFVAGYLLLRMYFNRRKKV